jgi:hypothetical protein
MRKRLLFLLVVTALLVLAGTGYFKIAEARREASYRAAMMPYKRDLRVRMDRAEIQAYLDSHHVEYQKVRYGGNDADTYEIKIGEEPDSSLVCEKWTVYVALEFSPADKLRDVHLIKFGTCL